LLIDIDQPAKKNKSKPKMSADQTQTHADSKDYSLEHITRQILGAAFEVHNTLGYGFLERVYQRAMQVELQMRGLKAELEQKIKVKFKGVVVGDYVADLVVEDKILVELKADPVY